MLWPETEVHKPYRNQQPRDRRSGYAVTRKNWLFPRQLAATYHWIFCSISSENIPVRKGEVFYSGKLEF